MPQKRQFWPEVFPRLFLAEKWWIDSWGETAEKKGLCQSCLKKGSILKRASIRYRERRSIFRTLALRETFP